MLTPMSSMMDRPSSVVEPCGDDKHPLSGSPVGSCGNMSYGGKLTYSVVMRPPAVSSSCSSSSATSSASASSISEPLMQDERLRKVSFTGSTGVGKHLLKAAADNVLRTSMELGGNGPFLVFEDADQEAALPFITNAIIQNAGQMPCPAGNLIRAVMVPKPNAILSRVTIRPEV